MATIAHFASRGQPLNDLVKMSPLELAFLRIGWELELEYMREMFGSGKQEC